MQPLVDSALEEFMFAPNPAVGNPHSMQNHS